MHRCNIYYESGACEVQETQRGQEMVCAVRKPGPEGPGGKANLLMEPRDRGFWQTSFKNTLYFEIISESQVISALSSVYPNGNVLPHSPTIWPTLEWV